MNLGEGDGDVNVRPSRAVAGVLIRLRDPKVGSAAVTPFWRAPNPTCVAPSPSKLLTELGKSCSKPPSMNSSR